MARITVNDCLEQVPNRFELVLIAAERARQLARGAKSTIKPSREPIPLVALREIAAGTVRPDDLRTQLIERYQRNRPEEEPEADALQPEEGVAAAWAAEAAALDAEYGQQGPRSDAA